MTTDVFSLAPPQVRAAGGPQPEPGRPQARHPLPNLRPLRQQGPQHAGAERQRRDPNHRRYDSTGHWNKKKIRKFESVALVPI